MADFHFHTSLNTSEMDEIITPEQWNDLKLRLLLKHPELNEADLQYHEAREKDMLRMVEYRLQKKKKNTRMIMAGN